MSDVSDATLVGSARQGDREAFARLFARHEPLARRLCLRLLGRTDELEDILQEAALQAWLALDGLRVASQFGAWLAGISLNVARQRLKRAAREPLSWEALWGGRLIAEPIDDCPPHDELVEAAEFSFAVRRAVRLMPEGQRAAILLVYLDGLTYREAAAVLGIELGALKTRLHKGRGSLRRQLAEVWKEYVSMTTVDQRFLAVEMRVTDLRRRPAEEDQPLLRRSVVVLREVGGERILPIWVGNWEGDSIALLLEKVKAPRPLTHALTASLLRAGGVRVQQVRINRLTDETFYAEVVLVGPQGEATVDARPSDAIALALELGVPIYAANDVLSAVEAARADEKQPPPLSIGAAEIVAELIEKWPGKAKPQR